MDKRQLKKRLVGEFSWKRLFRSTLLILALIYIGIAIYAHFVAEKYLFQPLHASYRDSPPFFKIPVKEGVRLSALYLRNPKARYTLLYSHGNAEDIGTLRPMLEEVKGMGFSILAYDYEGYGRSDGTPSEANAYRGSEAAYRYLVDTLHVPPERIIAHGRSLGGATAVDLATRQPLGGLIMESSFLSAYRIVTCIPLFPADKLCNISKIGQVRCPILVMHGRQDKTVPFWHGETLFHAATAPKRCLWVEKAGHNDLYEEAGKRYGEALRDFVSLIERR